MSGKLPKMQKYRVKTTNADWSKWNLKDKLEKQEANLEEYERKDDTEYPGWTFLLSDVTQEYGICPFLNVNDPECGNRRLTWLHGQKDGGETYYKAVRKLSDQQWVQDIEDTLNRLREDIRVHVREAIEDINRKNEQSSAPDGPDATGTETEMRNPVIDHDELINNVRLRKEAKSQNKKVKEAWNQTLRTLDYIMIEKGIDFSKYIQAVYGYVVRYKPPIPVTREVDVQFESLHERHTQATSQLNNARHYVKDQKEAAEQQLALLIEQNFQLEQVRKYYKKWSSLTPEKKEERIQSYCGWYARQRNKSLSFADDMTKFILQKLETKELRVMDVKWDIKLGIITDIHINVDDNAVGDQRFQLKKRAPRILKSPRKNAKKKRDEIFQTVGVELQQRINRLMLFEMLKGQTLKKDTVAAAVLENLRTRMLTDNQVTDYVCSKYDDVLRIIQQNPMQI